MKSFILGVLIMLFAVPALSEIFTYEVKGMTCGSCVKAIKKQVCELPGVKSCQVEVGKIMLEGDGIKDDLVKTAVSKAGDYKIVSIEHSSAESLGTHKPNPGPTLKTDK